MQLREKIQKYPRLKQAVLHLLVHPVKTRPRRWLRLLAFLYLRREKHSVIYRSVRKDLVPFNVFRLGCRSVVESFSTLNNMVGDIRIGCDSRIGLGNTVIGPVEIGNQVNFAQNVVVSGLNHNYNDPSRSIASQGVTTAPIRIGDDVWVGANSVILAGVTIGTHSIVAAGSVVNRDVPDHTVVAGNPARIVKRYDFREQAWIRPGEEKKHITPE